uniref:Uncharacterized protein n=1 Tax=Fibrocapsa japonica TaxID=94617 RepID=A0A7S2V030_9STRA
MPCTVLDRVQAFLPQLAAANEQLAQDQHKQQQPANGAAPPFLKEPISIKKLDGSEDDGDESSDESDGGGGDGKPMVEMNIAMGDLEGSSFFLADDADKIEDYDEGDVALYNKSTEGNQPKNNILGLNSSNSLQEGTGDGPLTADSDDLLSKIPKKYKKKALIQDITKTKR